MRCINHLLNQVCIVPKHFCFSEIASFLGEVDVGITFTELQTRQICYGKITARFHTNSVLKEEK